MDTVSTKAVNTIEVYLAEKSFDYIKFSKKWPNFSGLLTICSIDYLVKGFAPSKQVYNAIFGEGGPIPLLQAIPFNDFRLFYKVYFDKSIKENCLSFYENRHYIDMLATTPVALQYKNGEYSKILPAYVRDLRIQESNGAKPRELKKWAKFFKSSEERIKSPQNRCGVILPQG